MTCVSNSVQAGLVSHSMPCTPNPADSSSPKIDGPELLEGKKAKKLGDCQCVMPGMMMRSTSASMASNGFALLRRVGRQRGADFARLHLGKHRQRFDPLLIVRNPVDQRMAVLRNSSADM